MTVADIILLILIVLGMFYAVRHIVKTSAKGGCGCGCNSCSSHCDLRKKNGR